MKSTNPKNSFPGPRSLVVTVPAWFTVGAARKVAASKGAEAVAFYDRRGCRTTICLSGLIPDTRLLAKYHGDLVNNEAPDTLGVAA